MPETRNAASRRAKALGIPVANVVSAGRGKGFYIAPAGVTSAKAKRAYAHCRSGGGGKAMCAAVSHGINRRRRR